MKEQFEALIGKPVTVYKISEWAVPQVIHCVIQKVYEKDYAQYRGLLHLEYKAKGKRKAYVCRIYPHTEMMVYQGYIDIAERLWVNSSELDGFPVQEMEINLEGQMKKVYEAVEEKPIINIQLEEHEN